MGAFPSGQRGQTVNLLSVTSVVRIHPLPPTIKDSESCPFLILFGWIRKGVPGAKRTSRFARGGNARGGGIYSSAINSSSPCTPPLLDYGAFASLRLASLDAFLSSLCYYHRVLVILAVALATLHARRAYFVFTCVDLHEAKRANRHR